MSIAVTGATGNLGNLIVLDLLDRGIPAADIVAPVRSPQKAATLADRGVAIRQADYDKPDTLRAALGGVERLLLVSSSEVGSRAAQHKNVIGAAVDAGVELIAYTSILHADTSKLLLAGEHLTTEQLLADSGIPHVLLRNSWYLENYTGALPMYLEHGAVLGAAGDGRVSAATRADFASAAAAVLAEGGHAGAVYELGGEPAFTLGELAGIVSEVSGQAVVYQDLAPDALVAAMSAAGVPEMMANVLADSDQGIARGELFTESGDLARLIGRPPTTAREAIEASLL
jgi:NAD(P)H dehydrogenase (quinone)